MAGFRVRLPIAGRRRNCGFTRRRARCSRNVREHGCTGGLDLGRRSGPAWAANDRAYQRDWRVALPDVAPRFTSPACDGLCRYALEGRQVQGFQRIRAGTRCAHGATDSRAVASRDRSCETRSVHRAGEWFGCNDFIHCSGHLGDSRGAPSGQEASAASPGRVQNAASSFLDRERHGFCPPSRRAKCASGSDRSIVAGIVPDGSKRFAYGHARCSGTSASSASERTSSTRCANRAHDSATAFRASERSGHARYAKCTSARGASKRSSCARYATGDAYNSGTSECASFAYAAKSSGVLAYSACHYTGNDRACARTGASASSTRACSGSSRGAGRTRAASCSSG